MIIYFIKTEYGVVVELCQWGQDKSRFLDYYATEWVKLADGTWLSKGWSPIKAKQIGKWEGEEIYKTIRDAGKNPSHFQNFSKGRPGC